MGCSKNETIHHLTTTERNVRHGAARGIAALLGVGLCLGGGEARADQAAQAQQAQQAQPSSPQHSVMEKEQHQGRAENPARRRLLIAGAATLGGFWSASAITASALAMRRTQAEPLCPAQGLCMRMHAARSGSPATLLIPVVGPWIALDTMRHSTAGAVGLTVLGIGQAIGVGMLIGGVTLPREVRVHKEHAIQMNAAPMVSGDGLGLSIQGTM